MKTSNSRPEADRFRVLVGRGLLREDELDAIADSAQYCDSEIERVLRYQLLFTRRTLLEALGEHYGCGWVEYDERVSIAPDILEGLDADVLCASNWFPVARDGRKVVIAASDPSDLVLRNQVKGMMPPGDFEFRVALREEIAFFIQDFLNDDPHHLAGNERTGLAMWRNNMARWRTKMASYRTDFANTRTYLSGLRGGLTLVTIGTAMLRLNAASAYTALYAFMIVSGMLLVGLGLFSYFKIKKSELRPPRPETLIEVTAATMYFLDGFQYVDRAPPGNPLKETMLCRLAELLPNSCVFMDRSRDHKVRSGLAHERNALAAHRTVLGCYRTLFSTARTGLSFIRTGISFSSASLGEIGYFGLSRLTIIDAMVLLFGIAMIVDGLVWYWPVRKENREGAKCGFIS